VIGSRQSGVRAAAKLSPSTPSTVAARPASRFAARKMGPTDFDALRPPDHGHPADAGTHIERIYTKIGASTRATATLFAVQHGLLDASIDAE
jgi:hypothetical protein